MKIKFEADNYKVETLTNLIQRVIQMDLPATEQDVAFLFTVLTSLANQWKTGKDYRIAKKKYKVELIPEEAKAVWNICNICLKEGFINPKPIAGLFDNQREVSVAQKVLEDLAPKLEMYYFNVEAPESLEQSDEQDSQTPDCPPASLDPDNPSKGNTVPLHQMNGDGQKSHTPLTLVDSRGNDLKT